MVEYFINNGIKNKKFLNKCFEVLKNTFDGSMSLATVYQDQINVNSILKDVTVLSFSTN